MKCLHFGIRKASARKIVSLNRVTPFLRSLFLRPEVLPDFVL